MVEDIKDQLDQAVDDKHVKAIILRINSPGGEVVASDAIYQAVLEARDEETSRGEHRYFGRFGRVLHRRWRRLYYRQRTQHHRQHRRDPGEFYGGRTGGQSRIKFYTFKSGKYKDILNPTREPTEDEKALVQGLIMEVYDKFVGIVAKEREMKVDDLKNGLADGRILSGKQALDAGFVDGLGYFDDAIDKAKELGKIKKARVVRYVAPFSLRNLLRFVGKNDRTKIQIELTPNQFKLQTGKLYFLPGYMFQ